MCKLIIANYNNYKFLDFDFQLYSNYEWYYNNNKNKKIKKLL